MSAMMKMAAKIEEGVKAKHVTNLSNDLTFGINEKSYKAVKKYLTKGEGHGLVLDDAVIDATDNEDGEMVTIPHPHLIMGKRSLTELSPASESIFKSILPQTNGSSLAIDVNTSSPLSLTTIALDGNTEPKGDDFDRVAFQMRLNPKKKAMTILPEEAVSLLIAQCRRNVHEAHVESLEEVEEDGEIYMDYPPSFAIPGWAAMDSTVEALIDAAKGACGPSLHQRSIAACVGAVLPPSRATTNGVSYEGGKTKITPSKLTNLLMETMKRKDAEASKEATKEAALNKSDPVEPDPFVPLVILAGVTSDGIELTALQLSKPQTVEQELHCPFGNISVISSVCYSHNDPLTLVNKALDELRDQVGVIIPESEEPTAVVTYGSIAMQVKLATKLKAKLETYGKEGQGNDDWDGWDQDISIVSTKEDCVSTGLAVLAASVHGRVHLVVSVKGTDGKNRSKAKLAVAVQDVATSAVAVSFNYFGGDEKKWTEPKVIFDFDRRVPAGPYQIDFTAAECAAHVKYCAKNEGCRSIEDEALLIEQAHNMKGFGGIPDREAAALQLSFKVLQKTERKGDWIRCGDVIKPLSMQHSQKEEGELVACESAVMELSLNPVGLITNAIISNGETIVQANKSARNSKLLRWAGIIGSIAFIGGFLIKSYVEEKIFERDTQRVMAFYKHAAPNSFHDGDERQARYLVWKYKGKKDALWRRLEAKYGEPVRHAWEWEDEEDKKEDEEEDADDLDGEKNSEEETKEEL